MLNIRNKIMRHRIVEYGTSEFVLQECELFLWYDLYMFEGRIHRSYNSKIHAENALKELLEHRSNLLKRKEDEKLRIKNAKYHYIEENNG